MSHDEHKNTNTRATDTDHDTETSRRGLLVAGAAVVAGVAAASSAPNSARAAPEPGPGVWLSNGLSLVRMNDISYSPADPSIDRNFYKSLIDIMKEAWKTWNTSNGFKEQLVNPANTYEETRNLMNSQISGNIDKIMVHKPKVIDVETYTKGYVKPDVEEIVFVLPTPPIGGNQAHGATVRAVMAAVPFGM